MTRIYAKKVHYDGYVFDSEMEHAYYLILKDRLLKKEITNLKVHPKYVLQPSFEKDGKVWREINYEADFEFMDIQDDCVRVVDVKGMVLPEFEIHWKMFEFHYPGYHLEVLKYSKTTGWVELADYKSAMRSKRAQVRKERAEYKRALERVSELSRRISELESKSSLTEASKNKINKYRAEIEILLGKKGD